MNDHHPGKLSDVQQGLKDALAEAYPGWTIWVVPSAIGPSRWCAGRGKLGEVYGDSAEHLADHIRLKLEDEAAAARRGQT